MGAITSISGVTINYFLPRAFLRVDYTMMLNVFFLILTGFVLGLTLLTNNF